MARAHTSSEDVDTDSDYGNGNGDATNSDEYNSGADSDDSFAPLAQPVFGDAMGSGSGGSGGRNVDSTVDNRFARFSRFFGSSPLFDSDSSLYFGADGSVGGQAMPHAVGRASGLFTGAAAAATLPSHRGSDGQHAGRSRGEARGSQSTPTQPMARINAQNSFDERLTERPALRDTDVRGSSNGGGGSGSDSNGRLQQQPSKYFTADSDVGGAGAGAGAGVGVGGAGSAAGTTQKRSVERGDYYPG